MGKGIIVSALLLVSPISGSEAGDLIGSIPDRGGSPPPQTVGPLFFESPTRYIRFSAPPIWPWGPNIHGYDYSHIGCEGVEWSVIGTCFVNGSPIPPSDHFHDVNVYGECVEIYEWEEVVVDLGAPGTFSVELFADNKVGTGAVAMYWWDIYSETGPTPVSESTWGEIKARYR